MTGESHVEDLDLPGPSQSCGSSASPGLAGVAGLLNNAALSRITALERQLQEERERNLELSVALAALSLNPDPALEGLRGDLQALQAQLEQAEAASDRWQAEAEEAIHARNQALALVADLEGQLRVLKGPA